MFLCVWITYFYFLVVFSVAQCYFIVAVAHGKCGGGVFRVVSFFVIMQCQKGGVLAWYVYSLQFQAIKKAPIFLFFLEEE